MNRVEPVHSILQPFADFALFSVVRLKEEAAARIQVMNEQLLLQKLKDKVTGNPGSLETLLSALQML